MASLHVELESKIFGAWQGTLFVAEYYGMLTGHVDWNGPLSKFEASKDVVTLAQLVKNLKYSDI